MKRRSAGNATASQIALHFQGPASATTTPSPKKRTSSVAPSVYHASPRTSLGAEVQRSGHAARAEEFVSVIADTNTDGDGNVLEPRCPPSDEADPNSREPSQGPAKKRRYPSLAARACERAAVLDTPELSPTLMSHSPFLHPLDAVGPVSRQADRMTAD